MENQTQNNYDLDWLIANKKQPCPRCNELIGNINGSKEAICHNCGFKDPCCE